MNEKRVEAIISTSNIRHNYQNVRKAVGDDCRIISVVKADAYGHGAIETGKAIEQAGGNFFAVACIDEAVALRRGGINSDIFILGVTPADMADVIFENDFIQSVNSVEYASELDRTGYHIRVHIKIDTGMSRFGLYCHNKTDTASAAEKVRLIHSLSNLSCEGIFTHFACSDDISSELTKKQYESFKLLCDTCSQSGLVLGLRHCCNSAAILNYPEMKLDAVRAGLLLYGLSPVDGRTLPDYLPALELTTRIAQISYIKKGDTVSYGAAYTAAKDMKTATISIGYADGFTRLLSNRVSVLINGKPAPIIGKICMDLCIADVSDIECSCGDRVVVFGNGQSVDVLASLLGTINYELLCSIKDRVPRSYNSMP